MKYKRYTSAVLAFVFAVSLTACNSGQTAKKGGNYIMATGGTSGAYYPFGKAMSLVIGKYTPNTNIAINTTGGSIDNIRLVAGGESDIALAQNDVLDYAIKGIELFEGETITGVSVIATLYPEICHVVVKEDSGIESIADLAGKRVSVGDSGSGVEANAKQILEAYGIEFKDLKASRLSFKESAKEFLDGYIDAFFVTSAEPNPAIDEIALKSKIKILSIEPDKIKSLQEKYPYYTEKIIPKNVYDTKEDITSVAVKATLIVSSKLSETEVYGITKALFEHLDELSLDDNKYEELSLKKALEGISVELHPGAEKYFKEKGILK